MDSKTMQPSGDALVTRYAQPLDQGGMLAAALRISANAADKISPLLVRGGGITYNGSVDEAGLSKFACYNGQEVVERRNLEVRAALSRLGLDRLGPVFAGMFPLDGELRTGRIISHQPHGAVILLDGHALDLLAGTIRLVCDFFMEPGTVSAEDLLSRFSVILEDHVRQVAQQRTTGVSRVFFAPPRDAAVLDLVGGAHAAYSAFLGKQDDSGSVIWTDIANACIRFVIAHEYGHLLVNQDATVTHKGKDIEFAADRWAVRLLLAHEPAVANGASDPALLGGIGRAASLFAPAALGLAATIMRADTIFRRTDKAPSAAIALLVRRQAALAHDLVSSGTWPDDILVMVSEFHGSLSRLTDAILERLKVRAKRG